jgi:hypothetical protein
LIDGSDEDLETHAEDERLTLTGEKRPTLVARIANGATLEVYTT